MSENWAQAIQALHAKGYSDVGGVLQPARPTHVTPESIQLGYPGDYEPMRKRAAGVMATRIAEALAKLAGHQVECQFVSTGGATDRGPVINGRPMRTVTGEDRKKVENDSAVRTITDLFGGRLEGIRHDPDMQEVTSATNQSEGADENDQS